MVQAAHCCWDWRSVAGTRGGPGRGAGRRRQGLSGQQIGTESRPTGGRREARQRCWAWRSAAGTRGGPARRAGRRWWRRTAGVEDTGGSCRGAGGRRQGLAGLRDRPLRAEGSRVAISRAGCRPPAHTAARPNKIGPAAAEDLSGQQATQSRPAPQGAGRLTRQAARQPSAKGSAHLGAVGTQAHDHAAFLPRPPRGCGNTLTGTARQRAHARR